MIWSEWEKGLLALVMWREARSEGEIGMRAVGHVIRNRVLAWNSSYSKVICDVNQFTSISVHNDQQTTVYPREDDAQFGFCLSVVDSIVDQSDPDVTSGALYYENLAISTSEWFEENIVNQPDKHPVRAKIGRQVFFA